MWNSLVALTVALFLVDTCSAQNYLQVYPVGCGYDVVQQNIKLCYIDYYYSAGFEFLGYQYPDAMICSYPSYSFYESEYSEMQTDAFSYTVNSEQDTSLDLQLHGANWMLGFGFENTYSYAYSLLGGDISYFATSNQIYPHYGCRLQSSYEEGIKYLAQILAGMPDDCTASEDMDQYISLVETTGTHYVIQANFGQSVNFTVSVQKAAMASLSYSEQEEIINAGILNVEADQGIGLSSAQNDTASQWNAYYSSMSYNITVYRGGIYTGDFNSWLASGSDYANNVWLPFCVSMIPMDEMVPFYVPEAKRMCFSNAVVMYWQSFGSSGQATMKPKC